MKVAHVCTSRLSYKVLQDKLVLLKNKGYEIDIISSEEGKDTEFFKENGIKQLYIDMDRGINPVKDIKSILSMVKLFKKERYSIIHTHTAKAGIIGRIAGKISKVPVVIHTAHGLPFFEGQNKIKYNIFKLMELVGLMFCDYFASQNEEDLQLMSKYTKQEKLIYEGNGIDKEQMDDIYNSISDEELESIKVELNIPNENIIMLMGARFESVKNHDMLIDALYNLKSRGIEKFTCILAGTGELENTIKEKVEKLHLQENIIFLGYRTDIYKFIKLSDIVVLTSLKEGIPRILMESMYFKKVIVATDVLGTREVVDNKETGYLVELGDSCSFADKLYELMIDDKLRIEFGLKARQRIVNKFTEKLVIERIDNLYSTAIKHKSLNLTFNESKNEL